MKKVKITFLLIVPLIIIACTTKASQTEALSVNDSLPTNIDNFLKGNLYYYSSYYDKEKQLKTYLTPTKDGTGKDGQFIYGTYISFTDSLHYSIYNTAPCGNDCFFKTIGKYYLSADHRITLAVDSTIYYAMCGNNPTEYGKTETYKTLRLNNDSIIEFLQLPEQKQ